MGRGVAAEVAVGRIVVGATFRAGRVGVAVAGVAMHPAAANTKSGNPLKADLVGFIPCQIQLGLQGCRSVSACSHQVKL